jgi:hypothetical protein
MWCFLHYHNAKFAYPPKKRLFNEFVKVTAEKLETECLTDCLEKQILMYNILHIRKNIDQSGTFEFDIETAFGVEDVEF